ncbi:hypothetical protein SS1G_04373 [Sclerotinia sclerotiorum 1980 UF-70]|uniref:Uncharacterized protein n=1 Tax=Sclerotinia sclerotiorum (strain ATCC 18683 / 1980 / Ss-1) TaxID=665079 RepID=A7EGD2_SCLS1|nr:hypothetical protein SS1G_04373 [Sclerotinia sclerotiorum 1980 UF-70]EDO01898.1 hypothetical protein SS1G_04373 [Sclerotinia sclerotiorum 1980 UF-70]
MSEFDIVVIGSGLSGLAFARFYLDIHPEARLVILEEDVCLGGVWSSRRSYDEFWCQSGRRMSGFSDVPLTVPEDAPLYHDTFEAKYVTKYLEEYAHNHIYNGTTLFSRIRFSQQAVKVDKIDDIWHVTTISLALLTSKAQHRMIVTCPRLVVATGRTSLPHIPRIDFGSGMTSSFDSVHHHKEFGKFSKHPLPRASGVLYFAVLGGGKSAADMVYESIKKGHNVKWIIRRTGEGPALLFPASGHGRYKNSVESSATRMKALFSPSPFMPKSCAFWCTGPVGLVQHDDFWDTISQNAQIYRNDVVSYKDNIITLDNGTQLYADELLLGTGWNTSQPCFSDTQAQFLGLPHLKEKNSAREKKFWERIYEEADRQVITDFPLLENPPPYQKDLSAPRTTVQQLYKGIAPLRDNSIAFLGAIDISNSFRAAETQAIWTTAYFDGNISLPPKEQMLKEVAYMGAFSKRRYPTRGVKGECFFFELVWYTDALLHEVGLRSHRKGWWADWVEPCLASDLKGMKDEYKRIFGL